MVDQRYLNTQNIPHYPKPLFFSASRVCHVTGETGLHSIFRHGGFRAIHDKFLWWSVCVTDDDISQAENDFVETLNFSKYQPFLKHFTTSPAFQEASRYGNFRFTFQVRRLLSLYSWQFCYQTAPILRVLNTKLYQKEINYSILVHPRHIKMFQKYPRLPFDDPEVCGYSQGCVTWCCQAPSDKFQHELEVDEENHKVDVTPLSNAQYFVWDHVALAFYLEPNWTLKVHPDHLRQQVNVCKIAQPCLLREPDTPLSINKANEILNNLLFY